MIVLTSDNKDWLVGLLDEFKDEMLKDGLVIQPIEFNGGWMLPDVILDDPRFAKAKFKFVNHQRFKTIEIREVLQEEIEKANTSEASSRRKRNGSLPDLPAETTSIGVKKKSFFVRIYEYICKTVRSWF